jgi:hypothetical protein
MATDTIIDDIHKIREEYAKRFNNDLKAICNDARSKQGHDGREVVPAHPKPAQVIGMSTDIQKSA